MAISTYQSATIAHPPSLQHPSISAASTWDVVWACPSSTGPMIAFKRYHDLNLHYLQGGVSEHSNGGWQCLRQWSTAPAIDGFFFSLL